jgi:hypothetical protein
LARFWYNTEKLKKLLSMGGMVSWKKLIRLILFLLVANLSAAAQEVKTKNVIIITLDGYRWQELFEGADEAILNSEKYTTNPQTKVRFGDVSSSLRRERLMPFFWNVIAKEGQLYGNRNYGNKVNCANHHLISYPGYSEMLVGFAAREVTSNDKEENPNATVLEFIQQQKAFNNSVAAFATWDAFPYILRKPKAGIHINAGHDIAEGRISAHEKMLNKQLIEDQHRSDAITFQYALEYLKRERSRVTFISFDETDTNAHAGNYDGYLNAAHAIDSMINLVWQWVQSQDDYKDKTTLLITTDHGRGKGKNTWKNHRLLACGSRHIWFAALGPDTPPFGEMKFKSKYYQHQLAKTIAAFLGLSYNPKKPVGEVVQTMLAIPQPISNNISTKNASESNFSKR